MRPKVVIVGLCACWIGLLSLFPETAMPQECRGGGTFEYRQLGDLGVVLEPSGVGVRGAGDFDGDGVSDLLFGGSGFAPPGYRGRVVSIVRGHPEIAEHRPFGFEEGSLSVFWHPDVPDGVSSASPAGDVDGDGRDDFLVGPSPVTNRVPFVMLVYGSSQFAALNDLRTQNIGTVTFRSSVVETSGSSYGLGRVMSPLGDVNGDGYSDFAIGAPFAEVDGVPSVGRVYVVLWTPELLTEPVVDLDALGVDRDGWIFEGDEGGTLGHTAGDHTGSAISGVGDVNGDGLADFVVGSPRRERFDITEGGLVHLILGSSEPRRRMRLGALGSRGVRIRGPERVRGATGLGDTGTLAGAGDVDGDGLADFLLGVPGDCCTFGQETLSGRMYLVRGRREFPTSLDLDAELGRGVTCFHDARPEDRTGISVSNVGDVDGDGLADLLIGAGWAAHNGTRLAGRAYLIFGSPDFGAHVSLADVPDAIRGVVYFGEQIWDRLGDPVRGLGDITGDGVPDWSITSSRPVFENEPEPQRPSRTFIIFGERGPLPVSLGDVSPAFGPADGGYEVTLAGRGFCDDARVWLGDKEAVVRRRSDGSMTVMAPPGDGIGRVDVRVARDGREAVAENGFEYTRRFPVLDPSSGGAGIRRIDGAGLAASYAFALSSGDLDADGRDEVAVAASVPDGTELVIGVVWGTAEFPAAGSLADLAPSGNGFVVRGAAMGFGGVDLEIVPDIDGDEQGDLAIGCRTGLAFVLFGGRDLQGEVDLDARVAAGRGHRIRHSQVVLPDDTVGMRIGSPGDLDGDRRAELAIGIPDESDGGALYIVSSGSLASPDVDLATAPGVRRIEGSDAQRLGMEVAPAGDVDGDGVPDLVVGAKVFWELDEGRAWIILGDDDFSSAEHISELVARGGASALHLTRGFGAYSIINVSGAGDFNGDGLSDVAISVHGGESHDDRGAVFVVPGAAVLPAILSLPGEAGVIEIALERAADFAGAVAGLGDFDGDGIDDLLVGSHGPRDVFETGGGPGRAYVVLGSRETTETVSLSRIGDRGFRIDGTVPAGLAGYHVAAGDLDGDGARDIVVGERGIPSPAIAGNAWLLRNPYGARRFVRGDSDGNGRIEISDAIALLSFLFLGALPPACLDAADADDNGELEITDAVRILGFLFLGESPPAAPHPERGEDPTADSLGCDAF